MVLRGIAIQILIFFAVAAHGQGKLCGGTLGDNIFEAGDFGSGYEVVYPRDPRIAPGYVYTGMFPLPDGFYTLSNDIGQWHDNWPTWLAIPDNSADPFGYMMVVNASYEPGIFYEQVIEGVCDNTLYEFSADVINLIKRPVEGHRYPNISFLIDGKVRYKTGDIRQDEEWHRVGFTFSTRVGQNKIRLTMRNNAPGGTGNDLAIDNISFRACGPYASVLSDSPDVICSLGSPPVLTADIQTSEDRYIQWQVSKDDGRSWSDIPMGTQPLLEVRETHPGRYAYRFLHADSPANLMSAKCRAISEPYVLEVRSTEYTIYRSIAPGKAVLIGDETFSESGSYRVALTASNGCDSIINLRLEVEDPGPAMPPESPVSLAVETSERVLCPGRSDGHVEVSMTGGSPPYTYLWSTGARGRSLTGLGVGEYTVTATDVKGQTASIKVVFTGSTVSVARIGRVRPASFAGVSDGQAEVIVPDGSEYWQFRWDNGATNSLADNLSPGLHSVTVTDAYGCATVLSCEIGVRLIPELTVEALAEGEAVRIEKLQFEADSSRIAPGSIPVLEELYGFLVDNPAIVIEVGGHTNGLPDHAYCDRLSTARARAVAEWIVAQGIASSRIYYKGYGKRNPVASNATVEGRRLNQRVEIRVIEK